MLPRPSGCCAQVPVRLPSGTSRPLLNAWQMSSSTLPRWVRTQWEVAGRAPMTPSADHVPLCRAPPIPTLSRRKMSWSVWPSPTVDYLAVAPINLCALWGQCHPLVPLSVLGDPGSWGRGRMALVSLGAAHIPVFWPVRTGIPQGSTTDSKPWHPSAQAWPPGVFQQLKMRGVGSS